MDELDHLHGRIAALEMIVRGLLAAELQRRGTSSRDIPTERDMMVESFRTALEAQGEANSPVGAAAILAIEEMYAGIEQRFRNHGV